MLAAAGQDAKVLAGGQSLVPLLNMRLATPEHLVDINRLAELRYVSVAGGQVVIGALARHAAVLADPVVAAAHQIAANLAASGNFWDLAMRDVEIAIAAFTLARMTEWRAGVLTGELESLGAVAASAGGALNV